MNRKSKPSLVSSTPHPRSKLSSVLSTPHLTNRHELAFEFEKDDISPITATADGVKKTAKQSRAVNKRTISIPEVDSVVLRKRKCTAKEEKESASSAAFKEMGVKIGLQSSTNILSKSRNLYNMFPQPVILDSDDEIDLQPKKVTTTKLGRKKDSMIKISAQSLGLKDVTKKRGLTKQSDECITINQHKSKIEKEPSKEMISTKETPQPSSSKPRALKKNPLSKLPITGSTSDEVTKPKDKHTETVQLISDSDDEDISFPVNFSSARKNTFVKLSSLKNIVDENSAIKWTPRSKTKNIKMIKESESVNSDSDDCNVLKTINVSITPDNRANKENRKDTNKNNVPTKNKRIEHKNPFPKELFSRFSDIVFHPSKQNKGAVIAPSLLAGSLEFGYVELGEAKQLTGKLKNITFVLVEGQVKAVFQGKSVNLSPGDILYINEDSGYQLHNLGTSHARLLYAKEKPS